MDVFLTKNWNNYLNRFEENRIDIYFFEEYVKLYEDDEHTAFCVVCEEKDNILIFPFLRAEIGEYYDLETAYGYGGPIANTHDKLWISQALNCMAEYLKKEKYICGLVRLHPLLNNYDSMSGPVEVIFDRNTVSVDTALTVEEIWDTQINSKNRNMIRKACKNGLVYSVEHEFASLDEFKKLYFDTMKRLNADDFYFFDDEYFEKYISGLAAKSFLGCVRKDGELICAALFMYNASYGHYHLEGSNHNFRDLGANNLLLWETAKYMHELGVKHFHLGGGYDSSEDNSLYKFKKAFGREINSFYIGKMIFDRESYNIIKEQWIRSNPEKADKYANRLLCYRY